MITVPGISVSPSTNIFNEAEKFLDTPPAIPEQLSKVNQKLPKVNQNEVRLESESDKTVFLRLSRDSSVTSLSNCDLPFKSDSETFQADSETVQFVPKTESKINLANKVVKNNTDPSQDKAEALKINKKIEGSSSVEQKFLDTVPTIPSQIEAKWERESDNLLCQSEDEISKSDSEMVQFVPKTEKKINNVDGVFNANSDPSISLNKQFVSTSNNVSSATDQKFLVTAETIPLQLPRTDQIEAQLEKESDNAVFLLTKTDKIMTIVSDDNLQGQSEDEALKPDSELVQFVPKTEFKISNAKEVLKTKSDPSISLDKTKLFCKDKQFVSTSNDVSLAEDQKFLDNAETIPSQLPRTNQIEAQWEKGSDNAVFLPIKTDKIMTIVSDDNLQGKIEDETSKPDSELVQFVPKTEMKINDVDEVLNTKSDPCISLDRIKLLCEDKQIVSTSNEVSSAIDQKFLKRAEIIPLLAPKANQIEEQWEKESDNALFLQKKTDEIMTIVSDGDLPCQSKGATSKADDDALSIQPHSQVNRAHPKQFIRDDTALSETSGIGV